MNYSRGSLPAPPGKKIGGGLMGKMSKKFVAQNGISFHKKGVDEKIVKKGEVKNSVAKKVARDSLPKQLKVGSGSNPNAVAGALTVVLEEKGSAELLAIGAGALNQGIKAVAIARGFVAPKGIDLACVPSFTSVVIDGKEKTAMNIEIIRVRRKASL